MGAYFRIYKKENLITKTLVRKKGGSPYPTINDFNKKILLIKRYLGDFIVHTKVEYDEKLIRLEQPVVKGKDIFRCLDTKTPERFLEFVQKLEILFSETGLMIDLLNSENILITKNNEIKVVDVWPLFFKKRVDEGDVNEQSYNENWERFNFLKKHTVLQNKNNNPDPHA